MSMGLRLLDELRQLKDVEFHSGVDHALVARLESDFGVALPDDHIAVLRETNGIEAYAGYFRLFGLGTTKSSDALIWNELDCWKFAWGDRCSEFWCFGETAWGDQYAYARESLCGNAPSRVYFLDALSMTPQIVATSFAEFLDGEFVRSARIPYDDMITKSRHKLGPLVVSEHLVYIPSILLGGEEDVDHVQKLNARSAMICNGDIAVQLDAGPVDKTVKAVLPFEDQLCRMRLRLVWD